MDYIELDVSDSDINDKEEEIPSQEVLDIDDKTEIARLAKEDQDRAKIQQRTSLKRSFLAKQTKKTTSSLWSYQNKAKLELEKLYNQQDSDMSSFDDDSDTSDNSENIESEHIKTYHSDKKKAKRKFELNSKLIHIKDESSKRRSKRKKIENVRT